MCVLIINTAHDGLSRLRCTSSYPLPIAVATERGWRGDDDDDGENDDDDDGDDDDGEYSTDSSGWRLNCRFRLNYYAKRRSRQATAAAAAKAVWCALCLIIIIIIFYINGIKYACTPKYTYIHAHTVAWRILRDLSPRPPARHQDRSPTEAVGGLENTHTAKKKPPVRTAKAVIYRWR